MKIIATQSYNINLVNDELRGNEPGIVVLPEGCWDRSDVVPEDIIKNTLEYRVSIIGTKSTAEGFDVTYLVRHGEVQPLSVYLRSSVHKFKMDSFRELYKTLNKIHEISPTQDLIWAIVRQCNGVYDPVNDTKVADLICVPSAMDHTKYEGTRELIVEANKNNIKENSTLMVQAVLNDLRGTDVFSLPAFERFGVNKQSSYKVHTYAKR